MGGSNLHFQSLKKIKQQVTSTAPLDNKQSCLNKSLYWAVKNFTNDTNIISTLLERGANVYALSDSNETCLDIAVRLNRINFAKLLLKKMMEDKGPINLQKSLLVSAINQKMRIFEHLISHCTDDSIGNKWIPKKIIIDEDKQYCEYLQLYLDYGFTINPYDKNDPQLIFSAVEKGLTKIVNDLLELGVQVGPGSPNDSLLLTAVAKGHTEIVKTLLEHGAWIEVTNVYGNTALHIAAANCFIEILELLLEHKANANAVNDKGITPLHLVPSNNLNEKFIRNLEALKILVRNNADIYVQDNLGNSPLSNACKNGNATITKALLEASARNGNN